MIRLFTGLRLPSEITTQLAQLRGGLPGGRWIEETDYHVTLQFVGNIDDDIASDFHQELLRVRSQPVEIILDSIQIFGSGKPRAIVVGIRGTPSLLHLQAIHERIARRMSISIDNRKYKPHVTIARLKTVSAEAVAAYIDARGYFRPLTFIAESFQLFSSAKLSGGGPYAVEAEYLFRD